MVIIEAINLWRTEPNEVHVRDPFLLLIDEEVPDAGHDMDVHEHEDDQLYHLESSLGLLTRIRIHDDAVQSLDALNFQETKH